MFDAISTYLQFGSRFCGIEHTSENGPLHRRGGQDKLYVTLLKKTKKEVDIESSFNVTTIKTLAEKLLKNQHAVLIINNESVLTKKIESDQTDNLKLVYKAFPNIKLEDFYYEVLKQESTHFVSICRKTYIEELINEYKTNCVFIIDISLGNISASGITDYINSKIVSTTNAHITIEEDKSISAIEKVTDLQQTNYDANGIKISNTQLLSFSGALNSIVNNYHPHTNFVVYKQLLLNNYKHSRFFSQFLKFGLAFLLGLLLINFFFFNHYYNSVNELQQTSQINQATKSKVFGLNETVNKTKKMVDDMLKSSTSKSSFYVNDIIGSLPSSILLTELNYQPLLKRIKTEQTIENNINTILISGTSNNSESFSKWITSLESMDWIKKAEILSYGEISRSSADFSIKLNIEDD